MNSANLMRKTTYILFLLMLPFLGIAQYYNSAPNHVQNGSFDYYINCPLSKNYTSTVLNCMGWTNFMNLTPDHFHTCYTAGNGNRPPATFLGYQNPADGGGYVGLIGQHTSQPNWREAVHSEITPLTIGNIYEISLSVALADCIYASDNLGLFFYDNAGTNIRSRFYDLEPQMIVSENGPITHKYWVRYVDTFQADSTFDNIVIGGFYHDSLVDRDTLPSGTHHLSYYFIDSVVVRNVGYITKVTTPDTLSCAQDSIQVAFETLGRFNSGNTFTVQLSDASGNFSSPINIGSTQGDTSGIVYCLIPDTMSIGTGYRIRLTSSDNTDTLADTTNLSIYKLDTTSFSYSSNTPVCENDTLILTGASSHSATTYSWTGPNGYNAMGSTPNRSNINLLAAGKYYITSSTLGCKHFDSIAVAVTPLPSKPTISANTPVCEYSNLNLSGSSNTVGVTYGWSGPNNHIANTASTTVTNLSIANGGNYIVSATKNGCSSYDTLTVTIEDAPDSVNIAHTGSCSGDTLKLLADTSTGNASYTWTGPGNFFSNGQYTNINNTNVNHTGWYVMTASIGNCSYTDSLYATIYQTPSTPIISYNTPICAGETLNLSALGNSSTFYSWVGPNNFYASGKTTSRTNLQLIDSGIYTVTATENGCISHASAHISINPTPFVNILSVDSICDGETVTLSALPSNAGANPQYEWFVNAQKVASGQTYTSTSLNNNDVIYCEMTDNTKCSSPYTDQSNTVTMTVLPWLAPSVSITSNPTGLLQPWQYVTFTANPVNAGSNPQYQWKRNGQNIVGATGNTWSTNNLGNLDSISVELVSNYKCPQPATAMSNGIVVSVAVSVNDVKTLNNISLIPNPNNGQFVLKGNVAKNGTANITIINTLGQIVHRSETNITDQTINERINLNDVASGLYLLRLDINSQRANIKFRVE